MGAGRIDSHSQSTGGIPEQEEGAKGESIKRAAMEMARSGRCAEDSKKEYVEKQSAQRDYRNRAKKNQHQKGSGEGLRGSTEHAAMREWKKERKRPLTSIP